ncbi:DNA-invertase hin [bacterium MnTg02]|nr:DNA-invertase hin [bacterium MnTg02]
MKLGYARVSTDDQSLDLQLDALRDCDVIYQDIASGAKEDRLELTAMLKAARAGDTIIVWKLDRLARSIRQLIDIVERLREKEVEFCSLQESIDTSTPGGELVFHIFGALAQFEREMIRERTMAGLAAARARGRYGGRPKLLTKKDVKVVKAMLTTHSVTAVAEHFGVNRSTIYRNLQQ